MVLQKRVGYEFNGYRVPNVPRGSRSIRGKRRAGKSAVENKMCAFELLASVAGELLLQKESSPARSDATNGGSSPLFSKGKAVKEEREDEQKVDPDRVFRECLQPGSIVIISDPPEKVGFGEESVFNRLKSEFPRSPRLHQGAFSLKAHSPSPPGTCLGKVEEGIPTPPHYERARNGNESHGYASEEVEKKPLLHLASSCGPGAADCEKSSVSNETGTGASKHLRPQRIGDRRIRKFWASRFWKVSPTLLKDGEFSDKDEDVKPLFYSRKMYYKRQRSQKLSFKRKRFFQRGSLSSSDLPINGEGLPCSPEMQIKGEASSLDTGGNGGALSPTGSQKFTFDSNDYQVKLSIKSFKVPELFIEIPETATVGSLKRTVMEAVTAILGGGLRIGVHLQGKKVRDDSKTLLQAGISHSDELDSLGFTLEPNSLPSPKQGMPVDEDSLLIPKPLKRLPPIAAPAAAVDSAGVPSPEDSRALVAVPAADEEALAIYPLSGKPRRLEAGPRRVRRPFSVYEVEALVRAVEKLGTGRWRDVKLCAFDSSKHRTYVDLKDKWKTLVHTARISPQRRRGEPVPQELLDRVLSAHAYWSQQQQQQQQTKPEQVPRLA